MTEAFVLTLSQNALLLTALVAGPLLLTSLVVGIVISLFQSATQVNEPTLIFVPKLVATGMVLIVLGSWMAQQLLTFTITLLSSLPTLAP